MPHLTVDALLAGLEGVRRAPADNGRIELIVRRPAVDEREVLSEAVLDLTEGLVGDTWRRRGSSTTDDGSADTDRQLTVMNARAASLVAVDPGRRALAGDQLYLDLDISEENAPPGTRLAVGSAVIEVTEPPHLGCGKFAERFGREALRFVNSPIGRQLRIRGVNAKVIVAGKIMVGDAVCKLSEHDLVSEQ